MNALLRVIGATFAIIAGGILATVIVVWVYSTFVAPGKPFGEYEAFAQIAGPWVSVTVGPLLTFLFVAMATKRLGPKSARNVGIAIAVVYAAFDVAVIASNSPTREIWAFVFISLSGRCLAAWLAVRRRYHLSNAQLT